MTWNINPRTALVTALAAGGMQPAAALAPGDPNIAGIDLPLDRTQQTLGAGGTLTFAWPAVTTMGQVNAIGFFSADPVNTQVDLRVNGISVSGPFFGALGSMDNPAMLAVPIVLQAGDVFDVLLTNLDLVNPIQVSVRTQGWSY